MIRILSTCAAFALIVTLTACGDFADRKVCTPQANPGCLPDLNDFTVPDGNGPNPNFPDPNAVQPSQRKLEELGPLFVGAKVTINEILLDAGADGAPQRIELAFEGIQALPLDGFVLRAGDQVMRLGELTIDNGDFVAIDLGEDRGLSLAKDAGSLALLSPAGMILDFVQWGAAGQTLEKEAAEAGEWNAGDACVVPDAGFSISHYAEYGPGNHNLNYWAQTPSLGMPNPARDGLAASDE